MNIFVYNTAVELGAIEACNGARNNDPPFFLCSQLNTGRYIGGQGDELLPPAAPFMFTYLRTME